MPFCDSEVGFELVSDKKQYIMASIGVCVCVCVCMCIPLIITDFCEAQ